MCVPMCELVAAVSELHCGVIICSAVAYIICISGLIRDVDMFSHLDLLYALVSLGMHKDLFGNLEFLSSLWVDFAISSKV